MKNILDYSLEELKLEFVKLGLEKYRASQVYSLVTKGNKFDEITVLSKEHKKILKDNFVETGVEIYKRLVSKIDGTEKYLFKLQDDNIIEGVLMEYKYGLTICVSTQVGCRMGCTFCASGLSGLIRNLTPGEILGQVIEVNKIKARQNSQRAIHNIVLMGSGEPFDNYDNVYKFLILINSENSLAISKRNISLSTSGLVDKIIKFADSDFHLTLTISLHAPNDEIRQKIMPIAKKYNIKELIGGAKEYFEKTGRRIIFEYALIYNVNDSSECAKELAMLVKDFPSHINLINLNEVKENSYKSSSKERLKNFVSVLNKYKISNSVRRVMGSDIEGACGQLRRSYLGEKK